MHKLIYKHAFIILNDNNYYRYFVIKMYIVFIYFGVNTLV